MATVNTLAGDLYELEERGRVQGWLSSVWGISAVFGPTLGGSLAQYASWRWIFVINLPLGAAAIALIARYLHEQVSRTRHRIDVAGAADRVLLAAGALIFGLLQGGVAWAWLVGRRASRSSPWPPWPRSRRCSRSAARPSPSCRPGSGAAGRSAGSGLCALGMGLLVIGPTTFLPTYGQLVLGPRRGRRGRGAGHDELRLAAGHLAVRPGCSCASGSATPR